MTTNNPLTTKQYDRLYRLACDNYNSIKNTELEKQAKRFYDFISWLDMKENEDSEISVLDEMSNKYNWKVKM